MMNLSRWVLPFTVLATVAVTTIAIFVCYRPKKPFYVRIKKRKRVRYQLLNPQIHESAIVADLTHGKFHFAFNLRFFDDEIINLQITDPSDLNGRYSVKDVIIMKPNITTNLEMSQEDHILSIIYKSLKITINCDDFELHFYKNNHLFLLLNSRKLFTIEEKEPRLGIAADFLFCDASKAYGLPQHAEKLCLKSTGDELYRFYNTDRFAYSTSHPRQSLYGAVPIIYGHGGCQTTGILWLNSSETYTEIEYGASGVRATFFSESGIMDLYALCGPHLQDCVRQNSQLTGVVPLPPLFSLGYHQSRFSYMSQEEVIEVSNKFEENHLPLDSLWMDVDYTDEKKYFTWNPKTYPDPAKLLDFLQTKKRKAVVILDPHIKVDDAYSVYSQCRKGDFFVKKPNGGIFTAKCWPGESAWIDFLEPKARQFYAHLHEEFVKSPILHVWNDMNEPALFETEENSMPKDSVHCGNRKHRDVHNLYGFYQTKATYDGLVKTRPNLRPFVLTRSHFAGSQRFAAIWTGDNVANWEHLKISIPMCLTASLAGFSLCGADIGGFVKHPGDELLQRWYQLGAWVPFFRGHSNQNVPRREPYLYDGTIQGRIRISLQERYRHLLHWYTLFWQHYISLEPVMRPLLYHYQHDENVLDLDDQFLVGGNILVCPVTEPQVSHIKVYLPGDGEIWYRIGADQSVDKYTGSAYFTLPVTMDTIPVFYRGGSIIPIVDHPIQSSVDVLNDCHIVLYIFCNTQGGATGTLYSDDGESFQYLQNQYHHIRFDLENSHISNVQINKNSGYNRPVTLNSVKLFGYHKHVGDVRIRTISSDRQVLVISQNDLLELGNLDVDIQEKFIISLS